MSEAVVIPTFARPELLALCLEKIDQAVDAPDDIRIYLDTSLESRVTEVERVRDTYLPRAQIFHAKPHIKAPSGCWNILNAIKSGAETEASSVYLVEEDVLCYPYYFSWHRTQTAPASCGRYHPDSRWIYRDLYCNPGSCLRRPLLDALIPHINDRYFADTKAYCEENFPKWDVSSLDDWLIRRVMKKSGMKCVYPDKPVCAHVGYRGYGVFDIYQNNEADLEKRIARARELVLREPPQREMWARDWEPYAP